MNINCIDFARSFNFNLGTAVTHIWDAYHNKEGSPIEELNKAIECLQHEVETLKPNISEVHQALKRMWDVFGFEPFTKVDLPKRSMDDELFYDLFTKTPVKITTSDWRTIEVQAEYIGDLGDFHFQLKRNDHTSKSEDESHVEKMSEDELIKFLYDNFGLNNFVKDDLPPNFPEGTFQSCLDCNKVGLVKTDKYSTMPVMVKSVGFKKYRLKQGELEAKPIEREEEPNQDQYKYV